MGSRGTGGPDCCERLAEGIDGPLLTIALALTAIGLVALYSASIENATRVAAQVGKLAVALTAMWLVAQVPPV